MADIEPLRALHYDLARTGGLADVVAPPYDVIDPDQRRALAARSPYNIVRVDLPIGDQPYAAAAHQLAAWRASGILVEDPEPALWALAQHYTGPDGQPCTRRGFLARVRIEAYGAGTIRPHERTHPGPRRDRLALTRATRTHLSPIFSLFSDPHGAAWRALAPATTQPPWGEATDGDGTVHRLWRIADPHAIAAARAALRSAELLIADGHHRYETARLYADEIGGEGEHRYALMLLVALEDPGLTVFPTHRLLHRLLPDQHAHLLRAIHRDFDVHALASTHALVPAYAPDRVRFGFLDARARQPLALTLKDPALADAALADHAAPYRGLDTAVLEALILKRALHMTDADIDHLTGLAYTRSAADAIGRVERGDCDAAFFMAATPVHQVQAVAAAGERMPPKSTYFFPKVPTGLLFQPLSR